MIFRVAYKCPVLSSKIWRQLRGGSLHRKQILQNAVCDSWELVTTKFPYTKSKCKCRNKQEIVLMLENDA